MRRGMGLSNLIRLAALAALGVWLLGGCASTSSPFGYPSWPERRAPRRIALICEPR